MYGTADLDAARSPAQRRAVLAERLLVDLGLATSPTEAAGMVAQALRVIGGATGVRIVQHDPESHHAPTLVLATTGELTPDATTVTDRDAGLELTVCDAEVPPLAVTRTLRALVTVLGRIERQEQLLEDARTDPLTGLFNRRALDERIEAELARQDRAGGPVSLLLLDIDHFKQVNDTKGHAHGDRILQGVADAMRAVARTADVLGRIGGDEFALLLADTGQDGAEVAARRLCERVRAIGVTISVGVTTAAAGGVWEVAEFLRVADEALYAAKHAGRDRVVTTWGHVDA